MFLSGIDLGGTSIKFGIFDEQLNLLQQWSRPTPKEPAEAATLIAAQLEPYHVAAIGAGAPGTLNAARETITADNLAWVDVPLAALLRRASGLPAVVINDGAAPPGWSRNWGISSPTATVCPAPAASAAALNSTLRPPR